VEGDVEGSDVGELVEEMAMREGFDPVREFDMIEGVWK
jgi:hypothetical protein